MAFPYQLNLKLMGILILFCFHNANSDFDSHLTTSRPFSIDELLFSEDLFPGYEIPKGTTHTDAVKLFTKIMEDQHVFSSAYDKYRLQHKEGEPPLDELKLDTRKTHFRETLHLIFKHNLEQDAGKSRFQMGVNQFADLSDHELRMFLGSNDKVPVQAEQNPFGPQFQSPPSQLQSPATPFPRGFDLRDEKHVTLIKNQARCGSCVFFSFAALLESLYSVKNNGTHVNLSEQMMLDCATEELGYENNAGCHGNTMESTAQFLQDHGTTSESLYKYLAKQGNCSKDDKFVVAKLASWQQVEATPEAFKHTLYNLRQPIAAAFYVYRRLMYYRSGVFDMCQPPNSMIGGHAVLIHGFGTFIDQEYWMVKNSWSIKWGEAGFFRYAMGDKFCKFERWGFTGVLE